jgi:hypothetical protein
VERGKGKPKEREVDMRKEVSEWEGCVSKCESMFVYRTFYYKSRKLELKAKLMKL